MKNGGWLDAYDDEMQLGGYVYPTNYVPQAENGIEGTMGGLTDQGFDYNGAWGGPSAQNGLTFLEPTSRKLPMGHVIPKSDPSTELAISVGGEDGEPAYLIPSFKYGKYLIDKDAKAEFRKTGEHLGGPFKTWQEADEWERTVRHPYVEKGQNIPTPFRRWGKDFAMGGSLPGSVGFTYARTKGIPSNGPYAKKTLASAQKGASVSDNTRVKPVITEKPMTRETVKSIENQSYRMSPQEALLNKLKGVKLKESQDRLDKTAEKITAVGSFSPNPFISIPSAIANFTLGTTGAPTAEDAGLDLMGVLGSVGTPEYAKNIKKVARRVPFFKGLSFVDAASDIFEFTPSEDLQKKQNGGEMKFYQEGLDWTPKNISKQGSKIKKDDNGYWNPDNWGKPVEINSNQITMQGVYEPLLGISDTGDTQIMYPGEDYTFDGESVTEYPVMQKGGRTPIYTDNLKDPRIRAYADSLRLYNNSLKDLKNRGSSNLEARFKPNDPLIEPLRYMWKGNIQPTSVEQYSGGYEGRGTAFIPRYKKPVQPVVYKKPQLKKEEPIKKAEQPKPVERKQNIYEGSPVYSPGAGIGMGSALVGFANQKGDTTYIKPEDYERFAVPKYGKEFIESKKKKNGGWLEKYK